ncbi:2'-5' RNA ligase family protein [Hankyongella ginsenosidimutans]|uniref:2'-5' RNA ligase family protein n=1 Tax=Hankyongella ginsenosidimutans TaxID=1763828 RepID=UPI001FEADAAA|nr:2'-5' RNA ligase family protein [Hankyongella ginsenosidimutans]
MGRRQTGAPLHTLFNKVNRALERVGLPPETRAYAPHITLARFPRPGPQKLEPFVAGVGATPARRSWSTR